MIAGTATITISASNPAKATHAVAVGRAVEPAVETGYQAADPGDRMADRAKQAVRVTELRLDGERQEGDQDGHGRSGEGQ